MRESTVFCSTCTMSSSKKFTFAISSADELFVVIVIDFVRDTWIAMYFNNVLDCYHASLLRFELYVLRK